MPTNIVSAKQIVSIMPESAHTVGKYIEYFNEAFDRFEINTPLRQAAFLAQVGHESTRLLRAEENLNYSANGLLRTFPDYFTSETASSFAYKPQRIANRVYAHKGGNGNEESGDGWQFRGRGLIQITLRNNYVRRGQRLLRDASYFVRDPNLLLLPEWAVRSSCDYWDDNNLNELADRNSIADFRALTRKVNRALRGLEDRIYLWRLSKKVLGIEEKEVV